MRFFLFSLVLSFPLLGITQIDFLDAALPASHPDSIYFSLWEYRDKEMSSPGTEEEYERMLHRLKLTPEDSKTLLEHLRNSEHYSGIQSMLSHYNLVFELYCEDSVCAEIKVSGMTGNITIENFQTNVVFREGSAKELKLLFYVFVRVYNFTRFLNEFDLEGITPER